MTTDEPAYLSYCPANDFVRELKKSLRQMVIAEGLCPRCGLPRGKEYMIRCECEDD